MEGEYVRDSTQVESHKCQFEELYIGHVGYKWDKLPAIQRNVRIPRDFMWLVPRLVVVKILIEGHKARALIDSSSLSDFMSMTLADQLNLRKIELEKPNLLHLVVQESCLKINHGVKPKFEYQGIDEQRYFDIANLSNYNVILGTPFLFQHKVTMGINENIVHIGSEESLPIEGANVSELASRSVELTEEAISDV